MPLTVHRSNRTEHLVEALTDVLAAPTGDPFATDAVVVHSKGLERYLQHQLAQRLGICANVVFPFPQQLLGQVQHAALGHAPAWSREALVWALLTALADPETLAHPAMAPLRAWLAVEPEAGDRRRLELVLQLAALFERYALYRPELVATWLDPAADPGWEPVLWRAVAQRLDGEDPGTIATRLEQELQTGPALPGVPTRVAFFSVGTLPPLTIRLVGALARCREVHLFVLTPSPTLGRPYSDHPLLASLGTLAADFQLGLDAQSPSVIDTFVAPAATTRLRALQRDLLTGRACPARPDADDHSVRVHACHGHARQLQVLRDELLWLLDTVPELQPRDIVVMAPDIEAFAPLVQATFSDGSLDWHDRHQHPGGLPRIPFRLADRGWDRDNPVARLLLDMLALADARVTASQILSLAELAPVQARFGFGPDDLPALREWVVSSGVRWGADADHRVQHGLPDDDAYTWRFGLDRLLLGQASASDALLLGRVPLAVEGRDERALLGGLVDLAESVLTSLTDLDQARTPSDWRDLLVGMLDRLVALDPTETWQRRQVEQVLDSLAEADFAEVLDRRGLQVWLGDRLGSPEPGTGFLAGGVTFCQLVPMRAIPFRVVCLLGMDDGTFPRTGARLGFDRMAHAPRPGDRSVRDDDRALFLEALLSARDHLVVLYTGRDPTDDRTRPPAVPVAELLDVLDPNRELLTTHHPLQPFATRTFDGSAPAHDRRMLRAAQARQLGQQAPRPFLALPLDTSPLPVPLPLADVDTFYKAPIRTFCARSLGAWLPWDEASVEDREPFHLERGLGEWALRDTLLQRALAGDDMAEDGEIWRWALRRGDLPMGMPGEVALRSVLEEACAIAGSAAEQLSEPTTRASLSVHIADAMLVAQPQLHGDRHVTVTASKVRGRVRFSAWLSHLFLQAAGAGVESHVWGHASHVAYAPLPAADARQLLGPLVQLYAWGLRAPLLWFPEASLNWFWGQRRGRDRDEALLLGLKEVQKSWGRYGEPDEWSSRILGDRCPYDPDADLSDLPIPDNATACDLAYDLWGPALTHELQGGR